MKVDRPAAGEELNEGDITPARQAATLVLLRAGADGPEVLLVQRNPQQRFMGGAWVFPGGALHRDDAGHSAAAVRELREEAGILLPADTELVAWSRWITPEEVKIRFDTWFFLAEAPSGTQATPDGGECVDARWLRPAAALDAHSRDELMLVFPTIKHLEALAGFDSVNAALDKARNREVVPVQPKVVVRAGSAEQLTGTGSADQIYGEGGEDRISGEASGDYLEAGSGNDQVDGGDGVDLILGGTGDDRIDAGTGFDVVYAGAGADVALGGAGADTLFGQAGTDQLFGGSGADRIYASLGGDFVDAGSGADRISSDQDDATILGGPGADVVTADGGAIEVNGGGGRDRIRTGSFADRVTGGGGADAIDTGLGDDLVRSRDGKRDHVRCGEGQDSVDADPIDLLRGCEITEARPATRRLRRSPAG